MFHVWAKLVLHLSISYVNKSKYVKSLQTDEEETDARKMNWKKLICSGKQKWQKPWSIFSWYIINSKSSYSIQLLLGNNVKKIKFSSTLKVKLIVHRSKTFKFHGKKVNITRKDDCCSHIKILFLPVFNILIFFMCILRTKMKKPKQKTTTKKGNATQKLMSNVPSQSIVERSGCLILFCCSLNLPIYDKTIATCWWKIKNTFNKIFSTCFGTKDYLIRHLIDWYLMGMLFN